MFHVLGWDIGGANIKAARLTVDGDHVDLVRIASQPFEIWREKDRLPEALRSVYAGISSGRSPQAMAVTMTAELSDIFATKREGVQFVLESFEGFLPDLTKYALNLSGDFIPLGEAQTRPLEFAATNWLASAQWIAGQFTDCLLIDVGSTTTDILPIVDGKVCVSGRSDLERLSSGELVFTGALRTNLAAIVQIVPVAGRNCRVASEYFAVSGDVHLILGHIRLQEYTCTTPDGRPPSIDSARSRLARLVCADIEMLSSEEIDEMARYIHEQQIRQICDGLNQVLSRVPYLRKAPVIVVGAGAFLGVAAAKRLELEIFDLVEKWDQESLDVTPCVAAAYLLADRLKAGFL